MRKFLVPLLAIITVIAVVAFSIFLFNAKDKTPSASEAATVSWLHSLQSAGTTDFDQSSSVLSVPVGSLVGFSDRPFRDIQDLSLTDFVALWDDTSEDSFSADPPNAALTYWDSDATDAVAHTVIVEITGDLSSAGNVLSMKLKILSPSGATLPAKMYWASLFIDNAHRQLSAECQSLLDQQSVAENSNTPSGEASVVALQGPIQEWCQFR